jgi:hypothetical protein
MIDANHTTVAQRLAGVWPTIFIPIDTKFRRLAGEMGL